MKFIKGYVQIIVMMEKLLMKDTNFQWNEDCQHSLDMLKEKIVTAPILVFPDWEKQFHVHVDSLTIVIGSILAQPGEVYLDHPIEFTSIKLSKSEKNYKEVLGMVYALHKFRHYLLEKHFNMFIDHLVLK
jgi:hypothetical protein